MSEAGDSSRRLRGGLFKRRRSPRLDNSPEPNSRSTNQTSRPISNGRANRSGDVCQLGEASTHRETAQSAGRLSWLFGKQRQKNSDRRSTNDLDDPRSIANRRRERRSRLMAQSGKSLSGKQSEPLRQPLSRTQEQSGWRQELTDLSVKNSSGVGGRSHPHSTSLKPQPTSLAQRRERSNSRNPGQRSANTRLQSHQATLIQAPTALQQTTLLQGQGATNLEEPRRPRRSRQRTGVAVRPRSRSLAIALYAARMLILSVGVGVLAGTILSAWNPSNNPFFSDNAQQSIKQASSTAKQSSSAQTAAQLTQGQELTTLKTTLQTVVQQYPGFTPGIFLIDLDNNNFMDWSGTTSFSAASTIKVPVLIAFFQDVDAGKIQLDEKLTMTKELIAPESGDMQYLPPGAQFTALETATKMITISDNTATNMLIARLGGIAALNQRFKDWGLSVTVVNSALPDLKGTNTTSPKELASLMVRVSQGELVSLRSRDRLLDIMRRTVNNSQLPQGIGEGATIAHKTGDIGSLIGDVGLIDMPSGKRYAAAVLVKRGTNDDRAYDLIAKVSRVVYQHLSSPATPQNRSATPVAPTPATPYTPDLAPAADTDAQRQPTPNTPERSPMQPDPVQASTQ